MNNEKVVVTPPFMGLVVTNRELEDSQIKLGAQNLRREASCAIIDDLPPAKFKELCDYVIIDQS